jgi:hypothetical protein
LLLLLFWEVYGFPLQHTTADLTAKELVMKKKHGTMSISTPTVVNFCHDDAVEMWLPYSVIAQVLCCSSNQG